MLRNLGAWTLCHWSSYCRKIHKRLPNLLVHLLQLSRSNHPVQPENPALVFDQLETGVPCRTHQLHWYHSWMMVMLKGLALSRTVMSLLEIGRHPMTLFAISLCTRKPTPCSCLYRSISCKSSTTLPAALRVLTFHVAMVISCVRRGTRSLCRAATDPVWIFYHSLLSLMVCLEHIFRFNDDM